MRPAARQRRSPVAVRRIHAAGVRWASLWVTSARATAVPAGSTTRRSQTTIDLPRWITSAVAVAGAVEIVDGEGDRRAARSARQVGGRPCGGRGGGVDQGGDRAAVDQVAEGRQLVAEGEAEADAVGLDRLGHDSQQAGERRRGDRLADCAFEILRHAIGARVASLHGQARSAIAREGAALEKGRHA
jgi:hypothetical protein